MTKSNKNLPQTVENKPTVAEKEGKEDNQYALLPLKDIVIFPHMIVPVFVSEDVCLEAVEHALAHDRKIFLSAFADPEIEDQQLECHQEPPYDVYDIGTLGSIMRTRKLPDGRMKVLIQGLQKCRITKLEVNGSSFPMVDVEPIQEPSIPEDNHEMEALVRMVRENLEKVVSLGKMLSPDVLMILEDIHEPGRLADLVAANLGLKLAESQSILSLHNPLDRLRKLYHFIQREIEVYQMQVRIQSQAKEEISKMQKEHYLREQMRAIKSELGDGDSRDEIEDLWKKFEETELSEEARDEVKRQLKRLERMHQDTSEAALTRTHIETILALPWKQCSEDNLDLGHVQEILDEDHYGLTKIKDRIIESIAVKKLNPDAKSPILCFVGPPGVGKTSLGRSIAKGIGREFERISLGGVRDEADIRGHRKTYVGAFPGRLIQAIKKSKKMNPVIMLDEIDKLASDHRGDPSSALLEVLDPEQNHSFLDHYLGVAFDLSKVMFIANANTLSTIPAPLKDRLEIIEVSGYTEMEKTEIANQFLIPKQIKENGLSRFDVQFSKSSVQSLIRFYTRESGLRGLEKKIASVCRKLARKVADSSFDPKTEIRITPAALQKHLGAEVFSHSFYHADPMVGVSLGLAYTSFGGDVLAIETNLVNAGSHKLVLTGQLGDVMKESAQTALSFIRSKAAALGVDLELLHKTEIHLHVPQGAIPKDGPSAGITLASSILSALLEIPPQPLTAMTGEISLHGKVMAIGGLKEKILAAQREGIKEIILPKSNKNQFEEIPAGVKKGIQFHFVDQYEEVFGILFNEEHRKSHHFAKGKKESSVSYDAA